MRDKSEQGKGKDLSSDTERGCSFCTMLQARRAARTGLPQKARVPFDEEVEKNKDMAARTAE